MALKEPQAAAGPSEVLPGEGVSVMQPPERYARLRAADAGHKLQALILPPEDELRVAALGAQPTVGPPPRLPHQLSPALSSVLLGWRRLYESCPTDPQVLQTLVGECYAPGAVFEDAVVSARGQEAVFRQFAMLGAVVHSVQVTAYALSVALLSSPVVAQSPSVSTAPQPPPAGASTSTGPGPSSGAGARGQPQRQGGATQPQRLHLTRVAVENVQSLTLPVPSWVAWWWGGKGEPGLQINLYVTSILLVASDEPLAVGPSGVFDGAAATAEATARRLAGAAAALGGLYPDPAPASATAGGGGTAAGVGGGGATGGGGPAWRIVHQVDRWHNVPLVWWRLRRAVAVAMDAVLAPLLGI